MAILDSLKSRFDESIKADKVNHLQALIYASKDIANYQLSHEGLNRELSPSEKIVIRSISAFEIFREGGRFSYGGANIEDTIKFLDGSYSEEEFQNLKDKFQKIYQDGGAFGIWEDQNFTLSALAKRVANNEITISRYLSIVFLNLFSYATNEEGEIVYFHLLDKLLTHILESGREQESIEISIEEIGNIYYDFNDESTEQHKRSQRNIMFQYLIGTEYFISSSSRKLKIHPNWVGKIAHLQSICNKEHSELSFETARSTLDNRTNRSRYVEVVTQNNHELEIAKISSGFDRIETNTSEIRTNDDSYELIEDYRQYIYFGAPGTGKSYRLKKDSEAFPSQNIKRITFHPNMTYGQFIGTFKPFPYIFEGEERITYKYIPGILLKTLVEALMKPNQPFLLIIEELNRANVSAVFGDFFQLLDRDDNDRSEYPISIGEDMKIYLTEEGLMNPNSYTEGGQLNEGLIFPQNFYIWTTMNSADQGVMPLDTAFKRRWEQKYFGINQAFEENREEFTQYAKIILNNGTVEWNELRQFINKQLIKLKIAEDKLLGPYFISKKILEVKSNETYEEANIRLTNSFKRKVLNYLFEDVGKHRRNELFTLDQEKMIYSEILNEFDNIGVRIFINHEEIDIELNDE
ncbi:Type-2 restriction enzyme BsuMI component YdiS [Jeotgalibaca dankookensis]|uniref:Type-2 restriction enzyme BsuMI component YdiS n=1 Tax=Jeotgalibaca dankookensis TaxID=708126 RepID=A0A1S6IQH4_9LACT|nr:AAA family ATPase [Jeotgalibaca dankookensis]AQS53730.1 Type-2 restriction enzyme BsuMI component YdiS [Jeotgalibaca dankookensis]